MAKTSTDYENTTSDVETMGPIEPQPEGGAEDVTPDDLAASADDVSGGMVSDLNRSTAVYVTIARDGLNLRAGPGTEFPILDSIPNGTTVQLIRREGAWGVIDLNGDGAADGHVLLSYLREASAGGPGQPLAGNQFVPLDRPLLQLIMDGCGKIHIRSNLNLDVVADALNRAMILAEAHTRLREVAFLSQAVIETDYFRTFEEYGKGHGKQYGKYYGRGMHQLTWKATYAECSKAIFGNDSLVQNPDLIIQDIQVNIKATAWYWRDYKPFNRLADEENIDEIIHRLYGGRITSPKAAVRKSVILRRSFYTIIKATLNQR